MERKIVTQIIDTMDGPSEVKIERVYNYVYDDYSDIMGRLREMGEIMEEVSSLKKENDLGMKEACQIIVDPGLSFKEKREAVKPIIERSKEIKTEIRALEKKASEIDKTFRLAGIVSLISSVLKDNGYEGDILEYEYWNRKVAHGEAWKLLNAIMGKDSEGKKKEI